VLLGGDASRMLVTPDQTAVDALDLKAVSLSHEVFRKCNWVDSWCEAALGAAGGSEM
jgi:hypothetical protein